MTAVDISNSFAQIIQTYGQQDIELKDVKDIIKKIREELNIDPGTIIFNPYKTENPGSKEKVQLRSFQKGLRDKIKGGIRNPSQLLQLIVTPPQSEEEPSTEEESEGLFSKVEQSEEEEPITGSKGVSTRPQVTDKRQPEPTKPRVVPSLIKPPGAPTPSTVPEPSTEEEPSLIKPPGAPTPSTAPEEEEYTIQKLKRGLVRKTTGAKYLGSGTPILRFLKTGERPDAEADLIAMEHDIRYTTATSQEEVNEADALFIKRMSNLVTEMPTLGQTILGTIAGTAISVKTFIDRLPGVPTEGIFVDYKKNKNRPERNVLLGIQQMLEREPVLTPENTDFIFDPLTTKMLENPEEVGFVPQPEPEPSTEEEPVLIKPPSAPTPIPQPDAPSPRLASLPSRTPVPSLSRSVTPLPDLRAGHLQAVARERMLKLQKEEEDRKIATLYTQNPDDYMSPSVPNMYDRPMYSDEWVDIKRLQRLQTPEYTRQEKEIWARNYQTPYQLGEGTIDNSLKDLKNVVEQIAQLERRLRYDYATKGLPRDERQPAVNWGAPMQRMGVAPRSRHERWDAYLDVVRKYDMGDYQHLQRQNEPPRSKLINREALFGLTRPAPDIPSQQKIYDEQMNESTSMKEDYLDIQNDMDYVYFRRRIRKD